MSERVNILGVPVVTATFDAAVQQVVAWAQGELLPSGPPIVVALDVHGLSLLADQAVLRRALDGATFLPDGAPLVWLGRLLGARPMERARGSDLLREVSRRTAPLGLRHYFLGGHPGIPQQLAHALAARYRGLQVAGAESPPFARLEPRERPAVAQRINRAGPDVLWVGLGTPLQHWWAADLRPHLACKVVITVGAAFDFVAGRRPEAPRLVQRVGLEWLWRAALEPRRLGPRYLKHNTRFLWLAARQLARPTSDTHRS